MTCSLTLEATPEHIIPGVFFVFLLVVSLLTPSLLDLKKQFVFYASYHNQKINQIIHLICIWPILWTFFVFLGYSGVLCKCDIATATHGLLVRLDWSAVWAVMYALYYALMAPIFGISSLAVFAAYVSASHFAFSYHEVAWKIALAIHVTAWLLQFLGHYAFEGRAPALLDNPAQAFLMAPLFVLLEVAFSVGYAPKLHDEMMHETYKAIKAFRQGLKP
eukprot:gnl/Spiro4/527_TR290_c0_g1_i1.p1 gnl/Spiro4/527_TR290_c0_g1~~gnl/Spiro4/527_TR290_c0_g1_i1.p1  ORF type:complete len:237 (-),score=49.00 gnl/Spiro4/527_TR290_c0_g1_i1:130-786(-)